MDELTNDLPGMCPEPWEPDILEDYESLDTDDKRRTFMLSVGYDKDHETIAKELFPDLKDPAQREAEERQAAEAARRERLDFEQADNLQGIRKELNAGVALVQRQAESAERTAQAAASLAETAKKNSEAAAEDAKVSRRHSTGSLIISALALLASIIFSLISLLR